MKLCEVHFSGTPLCGFERVTNETVLKFFSLVHPCVDLRESPMKLLKFISLVHPCVDLRESPMKLC